jgi:nicotinate-nucleotide pyrophosphorylase (carboxylating)
MSPDNYLIGLEETVARALAEDIGSGDITAELVPATQMARAQVICREHAVLCGRPWVDEVFRQVSPGLVPEWHLDEGADLAPETRVFSIRGPARALLTAERAALNFLQTLSGTATLARDYASLVSGSGLRILDTRKTLPGLRLAQKYAVRTGGCHNHRIGLYDAYLIKENHIAAAGGIAAVIATARRLHPDRPLEIEVESLAELDEALAAGADTVMLDNFSLADIREAVARNQGRAVLEASGGYGRDDLRELAATGVDCISIGALTKHLRATDYSMRFIN